MLAWCYLRAVAPRAGAWIETLKILPLCRVLLVAPRAGAWIETYTRAARAAKTKSPPVRGRGLKQLRLKMHSANISRPPCGGVD